MSYKVRIEIDNAPSTLELGFGSTLDQDIDDESYAFDNFAIVSTDDTSIDVAPFLSPNSDTIDGGAGNDTIFGEEGDDSILGGSGEDVITGGAGADIIDGGDDADTFYGGSGDVIDGGEGGDDNDTLIIEDEGATIAYDSGNPENGTVTFSDMTTQIEVDTVTYIHIMFDQHEVVQADNAWTESFQPGDMIENDDVFEELLTLFPELANRAGRAKYQAAWPSLKRHEAQLIA